MIKSSTVLNATQADGAQTIDLGTFDAAMLHQIHVEVSATPAAGTLTVSILTPGANNFVNVSNTIDLTDIKIMQFTGYADRIRFTPASFDADKSYSVYVISGNRGGY